MQALVAVGVLKEFKKEILILILVIIGIIVYFAIKKARKDDETASKIEAEVKGSEKENKKIAESLGISEARVSILRKVAHDVAYNLGTLPTQKWTFGEDEEAVILLLNRCEDTAEILAVKQFYEDITQRDLTVDINKYLNNKERTRVNLFTDLK